MNHFWDFVLDDVGPVIGWAVAVIVILWVLAMTAGGVGALGRWFTVDTYRALRYERHGVCGKCRQKYEVRRDRTADQMYGPDEIVQYVCPNGHVGIPQGNRRFAEW